MTGKSNASKEEMISAVKCKGFHPETDDEADAIAIMLLALKDEISRDNKTNKNESGSFQALGESGLQAPATSLALEFFRGLTPEKYLEAASSKKNKISV